MESTDTTATNSDANECCIGRRLGEIRRRKVGATSAQAQGLARKKGVSACKSAAGFFLLVCSLSIVSFNGEAVQILSYPDNVTILANSDLLLTETIRSRLITQPSSGESVFVKQFKSGRRTYFCRAFLIDSHAKEPGQPTTAVLLERGPSGLVLLSQVCQQFKFTQREREVLEYLLQGISSKVIANRMNLSPSTVKGFVRLIMIKTGVSSRSAIVAKIMMIQRNVGA